MIAGLQKMTLLDYPGKVACTVFLPGCNFRCPFCHNAGLLSDGGEQIPTQTLMAFLKKRQGLLDGVCITGGEPTLYQELPALMRSIKELGFSVKLDTNGSNPGVLKALVAEGLVDYVAMDIKNCREKYAQTAGNPRIDLAAIEESMVFLMTGTLPYEFRTTVVKQLHTREDIDKIGKWFQKLSPEKKVSQYFLQAYVHRDSVLCGGLCAPETTQLQDFVSVAGEYVHTAKIRGAQG